MQSHFNHSKKASSYNTLFWHKIAYFTGTAPYGNVPHLNGDALLGVLPDIKEDGIVNVLLKAGKLAENTGKGMCSFWIENNLVLLITDPAYVYEFKMHCEKYLEHKVPYWGIFAGHAAIIDSNDLRARKAYQRTVFDKKPLNQLKPLISQICDKHILSFKETENFCINNAGAYFRKFALELAMRSFMGIDNFDDVDSNELLVYITESLLGINSDNGLYLLGLKSAPIQSSAALFGLQDLEFEMIENFKEKMQHKLKELLFDPHHEEIRKNNKLFNTLWTLSCEIQGSTEPSVENLFPDAFFFLAGGVIITTADSFPIILKLILEHPEVKEKLVSEIDQVFMENNTGVFSSEDSFTYLNMIIQEAFRLKSPVPIIPARVVKDAFVFNGVEIKQGDSVLISPLVCHMSHSSWKDPDKFIPERFENKEAIIKGSYIPFGLGGRDCVGRRYGLLVLTQMIAKLFHEFDISLENDNSTQQLTGPTIITDQMNISLVPRNDYKSSCVYRR